MMVASEADEAWWPPTFRPSTLSRRWLALWMVQLASHSTLRSSSPRMASSLGEMFLSLRSGIQSLVEPRSLRLDAGFLDDGMPFVDLGLGMGGKGCGGLLLRRRDLLAEAGQAWPQGGIGQGRARGRAKLVNCLLRRAFRHPEAVPG